MKLDIQRFATPKLVIETDLNKKGFESGLDKIKKIASVGFKGIALSVGAATTALTALIGKSIQAAGELEQQVGGAEAVFKDLGDTIENIKFTSFKDAEGNLLSLKEVANDAYKTMGLSANDYLATINKMGALMKGSGLDTQKAMDLSGKAMQRAADVASIMGIDVNSAMESIAGAAKGNFTMMDNLGVAMNATTIEAYALSKGIKTSYNEMTNAEKVGLAMEMFLEKTAYAEGNYAKENETFAGSFSTLKASMQNFLSGAGDVNQLIDSIMGFSEVLIRSIEDAAPRIIDGIIGLVNGIIPELPKVLKKLLPVVVKGAVDLVKGLAKSLPKLLPILFNAIIQAFEGIVDILPEILDALLKAVIEIINALAQKLPDLIPKIVDAILQLIPVLIENLPLFIEAGLQLLLGLARGIVDALPLLLEKIPQIIEQLVVALTDPEMILKLLEASFQINLALAEGLIKSIPILLKSIPTMIINIHKKFIEKVKSMDWGKIGKDILKGIIDGFGKINSYLNKKVNEFKDKITKKFEEVFGIKSPSRVMRDQIGVYLAEGIGVGFEKEIDNVYRDMQNAIDLEQSKLQASVETGSVFNTLQNSTPVAIDINADVEMDGTKVGRMITPVISKTIKTGGGV